MASFSKIWEMYRDGFKSMTVGRSLWLIILLKLVLIFLVLKLYFYPDKLSTEYDNDADRAAAVREALKTDDLKSKSH